MGDWAWMATRNARNGRSERVVRERNMLGRERKSNMKRTSERERERNEDGRRERPSERERNALCK